MVNYNKEHYPNGLNHNFSASVDVLFEKYGNMTGECKVINPLMHAQNWKSPGPPLVIHRALCPLVVAIQANLKTWSPETSPSLRPKS